MKIYCVRHAKPVGAEKGSRFLGRTDAPLSEEGRSMAHEAGKKISEMEGGSVTGIISSPLTRCRETADIIAEHVKCGFAMTDPDLAEIDLGVWDGKYAAEIREEFPEEYEARGRDLWNYRIPGGETFAETAERFMGAVDRLTERSEPDDVLIIVSHAGAIRSAMSILTGIPIEEWMKKKVKYAEILVLDIDNDNRIFVKYTSEEKE